MQKTSKTEADAALIELNTLAEGFVASQPDIKAEKPFWDRREAACKTLSSFIDSSPDTGEAVPVAYKLYDKRGIPFERGDVVKVYHFTGGNRKRYYMYKQCLGVSRQNPLYTMFSHLNFIDGESQKDGPYHELTNGRTLDGYEIVQSLEWDFEGRERKPAGRAAIGGEK